MKAILLATALAFGGAAFAQDTTTQSMPPDNPMPTPDGADDMPDTMPPEPMPDATMMPPPQTEAPGDSMQTDTTTPSDPMARPGMTTTPDPMATSPRTMSGSGGPVTVMPSRPIDEVFPPPPPQAEYPPCSATVTDGCIQVNDPG